jgi:hypothetical protein
MTSSRAGPARSRPRAHRGCGRKGAPRPLKRSLILAKGAVDAIGNPSYWWTPRQPDRQRNQLVLGALPGRPFRAKNGVVVARRCRRYRRIALRRGKKKAIVAVGRSILVITWYLRSDPETRYHDLGSGYYDSRTNPERKKRNYIRELEALGYKVTLQRAP